MTPLCTWCGTDEYVDDYDVAEDIASCSGPGHAEPRMFQPRVEAAHRKEASALDALPGGIALELGLYEVLPKLLTVGEWAETGVVEYRYAKADPEGYAWMLDRWGHVSHGPRRYSSTNFIGSTLGALSRVGNVRHHPGRGTGIFDRNHEVGYWTLEPALDSAIDVSWERFADEHALDPKRWPFP